MLPRTQKKSKSFMKIYLYKIFTSDKALKCNRNYNGGKKKPKICRCILQAIQSNKT